MEMAVFALKAYLLFTIAVMVIYTFRHAVFTFNRLFGEQRTYYHDLADSDLKKVSVIIPMHNEEKVAEHILDQLIQADYDIDKIEIIPVNDHSEDRTQAILDQFAVQHPQVKPLHRTKGIRGKSAALNDAIAKATGDIIIVFDADYLPPRGIIKNIAICFNDPEVGAVMGRVIPINTHHNFLTRMLDLERCGGYQVDQQARYNLKLMPQYGGTVGGFRKQTILDIGGFDPKVLAEDTDITYRLSVRGWKVVYANRAECYEEVPEEWSVRSRQLKRWARGHNVCMFRYMLPLLGSKYLSLREKADGFLLLAVFFAPVILLFGICDSIVLFFLGEMEIFSGVYFLIFLGAYNSFGNFAPFFQVGTACILDGGPRRVLLIPMMIFNFFFNMWYIFRGFLEALVDIITARKGKWQKTKRYRTEEDRGVGA